MADPTSGLDTTDGQELGGPGDSAPQDARQWGEHWRTELDASEKEVSKWWKKADKVLKWFLDEKGATGPQPLQYRVNLYSSNIQLLRAFLYGRAPQADVSRKWGDALDNDARVAGEILERQLNSDMAYDGDGYQYALAYALDDRLMPGMGNARVYYEAKFGDPVPDKPAMLDPQTGQELAPAVPGYTPKVSEECRIGYVHWRDQLWSPCRTFQEARWFAFRGYPTQKEAVDRFGEEVAGKLTFSKLSSGKSKSSGQTDQLRNDPWARGQIWEIWSKEHGKVFWLGKGSPDILDVKDDPYELEGFWPFECPMVANSTTSGFMPIPDLALYQDLYREWDQLCFRISLLTKAVRLVGVYDKKIAPQLARLVGEANDNDMIGIDSWAAFAEKGGLEGVVSFLPLKEVTAVLEQLNAQRDRVKSMIDELTGMGDILRGAAEYVGNGPATATEQSIKSKFASVRIDHMKSEMSRFASGLLRKKAEIICKHYSPETLMRCTNIANTYDAQAVQGALQLLKDRFPEYRIEVQADTLAMQDFTKMKNERVEALTAFGGFMQQAVPAIQMFPQGASFLMELVKWTMASFSGARTIEGPIDQLLSSIQQQASQPQQPQQQQPDPKLLAVQAKAAGDVQKTQADHAARMEEIQAEAQAEFVKQQAQTEQNLIEEAGKQQIKAQHEASRLLSGGVSRPNGGHT